MIKNWICEYCTSRIELETVSVCSKKKIANCVLTGKEKSCRTYVRKWTKSKEE